MRKKILDDDMKTKVLRFFEVCYKSDEPVTYEILRDRFAFNNSKTNIVIQNLSKEGLITNVSLTKKPIWRLSNNAQNKDEK